MLFALCHRTWWVVTEFFSLAMSFESTESHLFPQKDMGQLGAPVVWWGSVRIALCQLLVSKAPSRKLPEGSSFNPVTRELGPITPH